MRPGIAALASAVLFFGLGALTPCQAQVAQTKREMRQLARQAQRQAQKQAKRQERRQQLAQDLPPVVRRAIGAMTTIRLSGDRLVDQKVKGELVRHTEHVVRDGAHIAITFPGDSKFAGQKIVDNGTTRLHYFKGGRLMQQPSQRDDTMNRFIGPANQLRVPRFNVVEGPTIAGYRTSQVNVFDKAGGRVQELDIEPNSGAVLKRVGFDKTGAVVASSEYANINFNPTINASTWDVPNVRIVVTQWDQLRNQARKAGVPALGLAGGSGFQLESTRVANRPNGQTMLHSVYQGPNGKLSVFVLSGNVNMSEFNRVRPGAQNQIYPTQRAGATVVLIGPYNSSLLERLAGLLQTQ